MGLFGWLFGRRRRQDEVRKLWELTLRVVRDDATQLAMAPAEIRERFAAERASTTIADTGPRGVGRRGWSSRAGEVVVLAVIPCGYTPDGPVRNGHGARKVGPLVLSGPTAVMV